MGVFLERETGPCSSACPAGIDVPRYVRLIADRRFDEALMIIMEKIPFPSVCGQVCFAPCEAKCNANYLGSPIAIRALKRFVARRPNAVRRIPSPLRATGKRVGVVGSGPAGLTAAYDLKLLGHGVTVFEAEREPGGMMRYGIPDYRLPKELLRGEIEAIKNLGVDIKTNERIENPVELLGHYDAVLVAIGAAKSASLGIEGETLPIVKNAIGLMKDINNGKKITLGSKVLVIGGGNGAIDAARSALRLGSQEVYVFYRRSCTEMPASPSEVDEAQKEGVKIQFLIEPLRITMVGGRANVECIRTQLTEEIDPSGRKKPIQLPGTEFSDVADTLIVAAGQVCELPPGFSSIATGNFVQADPNTMSTSQVGILAAGAAIRGGSSVIEAISAGIRAASCIDRYLGDKIEIQTRSVLTEPGPVQSELQGIPPSRRVNIPKIPVSERLKDFSPIELELKEEQAVEEAKRCLACDLPIVIEPDYCVGCLTCVLRCASRLHDRVDEEKSKIRVLPMLERSNALIFREGCEVCGICARYCPHGALYRQRKYFGS